MKQGGSEPESIREVSNTRLNERDLKVLRWVGEMQGVELATLGVILGLDRRPPVTGRTSDEPLGLRGTQRVVRRWSQLGVAESWRPLTSVGTVIRLTSAGAELAGFARVPARPRLGTLEHTLAAARLRAVLEANGQVRVAGCSDGILEALLDGEPESPVWIPQSDLGRFGLASRGVRADHWPDAALIWEVEAGERLDTAKATAIELERTTKGKDRYAEILRELASKWNAVDYYCLTESVAATVGEAITRSLASCDAQRFRVYLLGPDNQIRPRAVGAR